MFEVTCPFCGHEFGGIKGRQVCPECTRTFVPGSRHQVSLKHIAMNINLLDRVADGRLELDTNRQLWRGEFPTRNAITISMKSWGVTGKYINDIRRSGLILIGRYVIRYTGSRHKPYVVYRFGDAELAERGFLAMQATAFMLKVDDEPKGRIRAEHIHRAIIGDEESCPKVTKPKEPASTG